MTTLNIEEIMKLLPHRYPFLLLDKIIECDNKRHIVGIKNITINEPFFQGHFPKHPIMPGVLQLEAMAQTGGILLKLISGESEGMPYFMSINNVKFRKVVRPGDQMRIDVEIVNLRSKSAKFKARIFVDESVVSQAEMMCMITKEKAEI